MNSTDSNFEVKASYPFVFWSFLTFEVVIIVFGNAMVCWCFYRSKQLRTKQSYFVISLILSDIFVGIAVPPCEYCAFKKGIAEKKNNSCLIYCGSLISFTTLASVINLVLIAGDRFLSITLPYKYHAFLSKQRAKKIIASGWMLTALLTATPFTWQLNKNISESFSERINLIYTIIVFGMVVIIGLLICFIYAKIVFVVKQKLSGEKARNPAALKVSIMVAISFFVCWIPTLVVEIMLQSSINLNEYVPLVSYCILLFNPCLDPIFYAYYRKDIRKEVQRSLSSLTRNSVFEYAQTARKSFRSESN
ncbi:adenosine receptor A2a [Hydra vulgaris]|uniref:adenosine receptor A2a n=1 Tax=Hydra vulgaris TaxID=6087 RepID=UPI000641372B|nr:adenosine receptor A2a [Hydra vulgaris]XP_047146747.1 adenosine receptor A2a [Hydra vulgaris]